jgi:high affinity Mn2+ porin
MTQNPPAVSLRLPRLTARCAAIVALVAPPLFACGRAPAPDPAPPSRFEWGWQATVITQTAPSFRDPYEGPRSFRNEGSSRASTTLTTTILGAARLWRDAWISVQPELSGGQGVGGVQGIAGYVNQDAVRSGSAVSQKPYLARVFVRQDIALGRGSGEGSSTDPKQQSRDIDAFSPGGSDLFGLPEAWPHLEITAGKFALPDFYDANDVAGDVHHRLMNWALVNDGAWDYAADSRGYTWGVTAALRLPPVAIRLGVYAMPEQANGIQFDHHFSRARAENAELEWTFDPDHAGVLRLLGYVNHARMGLYEDALARASAGTTPDVTATRREGRRKSGVGVNAQRTFGKDWGAFLRAGWNDGRTESFAYTEIDRTVSAGVSRSASFWGRADDSVVLAAVVNGLSSSHRRYLQAGGIGFQLGDGALRYGLEEILEVNYNAAVTRSVSLAADVQRVARPGYNADRGPIMVYGLRLHLHR